jgi:hypothetical protein
MSENNNLEVALAKLEGTVTTEIKHLSHDVKNLSQKLDAYPTRRDLDAVEARVSVLETAQRKAAWLIIGAWISGLGVVGSLLLKKL